MNLRLGEGDESGANRMHAERNARSCVVSHSNRPSAERRLTAGQLLRVGWRLRWDPEGYTLIAPNGESILPDDVLLIDPNGMETTCEQCGLLTVGEYLSRLLITNEPDLTARRTR